MNELVLTNAQVVLPDAVRQGSVVVVRDGTIAAIDGPSRAAHAIDLGGDHLIAGLVEIHTDNLEAHLKPRPGVRWPVEAAVMAHDAQMAASGITTVFDALAVGDPMRGFRSQIFGKAVDTITQAQQGGLMRVDHRLHLRCEVSAEDMMELFVPHAGNPLLRLVSVMDHTPGQRQWADVAKYSHRVRALHGFDESQLEAHMRGRREDQSRYAERNRRALFDFLATHDVPLASHDDTTASDVEEAVAAGARISEFPTTEPAAELARAHGLSIVMGAPNVILGGSHSGNVSAARLAGRGLLDILSSDYVPASLLQSVWRLHGERGIALPAAVAMVTSNPADAVGMRDRGRIAVGQRGDLARVHVAPTGPIVREVWRGGARIA
jgi:alpha-D-ribose 1-methylphosphonate 5-triphosphate diphosphatase